MSCIYDDSEGPPALCCDGLVKPFPDRLSTPRSMAFSDRWMP
jgi:hypothetical protein